MIIPDKTYQHALQVRAERIYQDMLEGEFSEDVWMVVEGLIKKDGRDLVLAMQTNLHEMLTAAAITRAMSKSELDRVEEIAAEMDAGSFK